MKQTNQPTNPPFWKHSKPTTTTTTATAIACFKDHQNTQKKNIVRKINNHKKVEEEAQKFQQLESFCYVTCKASSFKFSSSIINPCRGGASRIKLKTILPKRTYAHTHKLITNHSKQTNKQNLALKNTHPTQ
jgi:hypothetical protein